MIKHLVDALPETFDFYHLGQVEQMPASPLTWQPDADDLASMQGVGFALKGDSRGWIVILFDSSLDESTYTEMGNVIASRAATRIAEREGSDVWISPPQKIDSRRLVNVTASGNTFEHRTYMHASPKGPHLVEALLFSTLPTGEIYV